MVDEIDAVPNVGLTCASHSASSRLTVSLEPVRRRHERWPDVERDRILAESFTSGKTVAQVSRDNGVGLGLLHYWRRQARATGSVEELRLVPVTVVREDQAQMPAVPALPPSMELTVRDVTVRICGAVDPYTWLNDVLERIVNEEVMINDLHSLLAWNWRPATDRLEALVA